MKNDLIFLNALNKIEGIGSQKIKKLFGFFDSAENIWQAKTEDLRRAGIGNNLADKITSERLKINPEKEWEKLEKENIKMITIDDKKYPYLLREIANPPYILYLKTEDFSFDLNLAPMIAIVGSRKFTQYGKQVAEKLARDLVGAGLTIVSGLAIGIDSFAHRAAVEAGGKTIAVLGSSLEDKNIGPRSNFELSKNIMKNGALLSDYPLGVTSAPGNFPARNRIMAGLTLGTIVVEAARDSGTLITANLALEFNREVLAVPGSIFSPQSEGSNALIRAGAKIVTSVSDILEEIKIEKKIVENKVKKIIPSTPEEEKILEILSPDPLHIDTIVKLTKLKTSSISSSLSIMEIKGMVKNIGGQNYIKI